MSGLLTVGALLLRVESCFADSLLRCSDSRTPTASKKVSNVLILGARLRSGAKKEPQSPKNRTNSTKEFSEQFEGVSGSLPSKTRVLRQIAPESSPESSAKSLSHSFFVVPFLSPIRGRTATQRSKKGSEKVLERVLGKGSQKGSEKGVCYGLYSRKGFSGEYAPPPKRRAPYNQGQKIPRVKRTLKTVTSLD